MTLQKHIITVFLLFSALFLWSQELKFSHITANEGLGENFIGELYEDSYGFIWIGTKDGLSRYDGYDVKAYDVDPQDDYSLQSGNISDIIEDENGDLWIGTDNGLAYYRRELDNFQRILLDEKFNNGIYGIVLDSTYLWLSTWDGLCKYNKFSNHIECMVHINEALGNDNKDAKISGLIKDKEGYLWFGFSFQSGLVRYDMKTNKFKFYDTNSASTSRMENRVTKLYTLNDSVVLVGFRNGGLHKFNVNTEKFTSIIPSYVETEVGINSPWSIYQNSDGDIWVGALNGGLFRFSPDLKHSENFVPSKANEYSLNAKSVSAIIEDSHGNMWFGTHGGGVNVVYKRHIAFRHYWSIEKDSALSNNFISGFYENEKGKIWIATDGGGINVFNVKRETFDTFDVAKGLASNAVLSITPFNQDTMIVTTWEGGVMLVDIHDFSTMHFEFEDGNANTVSFKHLKYTFRHGDSLYIVTNGEGINIYDIKNKKFHHAENDSSLEYLTKTRYGNKVLADSLGNLWITANYGFFKISKENVKAYTPDVTNEHAISGSYTTDMIIDSKGRFWVATLNGLNLYDWRHDNFNPEPIPELLQVSIMSIVEDDFGNIWLGSNVGIIKYNPDTKEFATYDESDGLQGNQFFERSAYKDSDGYLYFGGVNGFNRFHPRDIGKDTTAPYIYLKDFKLFNKSQITSDKNSVLTKHINFEDEIVLDYSQKIITIDFVAIHILGTLKNRYKYKLKGFDETWYDIEGSRSVTYTNLSPGKYTFEVKASNADGFWTQNSKKIGIVITPPWWMRWWFRSIFIVFVICIVGLSFYLRITRVKKVNLKLEEKVKNRTVELEESQEELTETIHTKDRFFSIIAHDLKNPMNSLIGFSDLLIKNWGSYNDEKKHKFITMINTSSIHLYNLLINLLEWSKTQIGNIKVDRTLIDLNDLILENIELLRGQANKKEIAFLFNPNGENVAFADKNMLNTVIRNLLSNAIKYSYRDSEIVILIKHTMQSNVEISISDTGVGLSQEKISSLFSVKKNISTLGTEKEKGTGLGLIVCQEFVEINNGSLRIESATGEGSTFIVSLPVC